MESLTGENPLSLFIRSLMPWVAIDHGHTMESVVREREERRLADDDDTNTNDGAPAAEEQERNDED